jgi:hypothetical protein
MRLCKACYAVLPEPVEKAHRRRKFCNDACKQRYYRQHTGKRDAHTNRFWQKRSQDWQDLYRKASAELEKERRWNDMLRQALDDLLKLNEAMAADYAARLKGLGTSKQTITEFDSMWRSNYNLDQLYAGLGDSLVSQRARLIATLDTQRKLIFDK